MRTTMQRLSHATGTGMGTYRAMANIKTALGNATMAKAMAINGTPMVVSSVHGPSATRGLATQTQKQIYKSPSFIGDASDVTPTQPNTRFKWVDEEAKRLIAESYKIHMPDKPFPPSLDVTSEQLEKLGHVPHYVPRNFSDRVALMSANVLEKFMALFFRSKYDHHAVTLETVAAVPGFVAAANRHLRSLRRMQRDHGWIEPLLEESLNERLHLLIFMQHCQPTMIERAFVVFAQAAYVSFYATAYTISPRTAHRAVGYLEECAHRAYNEYLEALHTGKIHNPVLSSDSIGVKFYRLPEGSTLRDVVLRVRADEAFHALYNHGLGDLLDEKGGFDKTPVNIEDDLHPQAENEGTKKKQG